MPWDLIKLNDGVPCRQSTRLPLTVHPARLFPGNAIPSIAFGTWTLGNGQNPIDKVEQAISVGFNHIGTSGLPLYRRSPQSRARNRDNH